MHWKGCGNERPPRRPPPPLTTSACAPPPTSTLATRTSVAHPLRCWTTPMDPPPHVLLAIASVVQVDRAFARDQIAVEEWLHKNCKHVEEMHLDPAAPYLVNRSHKPRHCTGDTGDVDSNASCQELLRSSGTNPCWTLLCCQGRPSCFCADLGKCRSPLVSPFDSPWPPRLSSS